jgi:Flp pilus assembly protein TadD
MMAEMAPSASPISTARRLEYTRGYLELGLLKEAAAEIDSVRPEDQGSADVTELRMILHSEQKAWSLAATFARRLTELKPNEPQGWISWAYATRRLVGVEAAEPILRNVPETVSAACSIIPYNLACYRCVQGDVAGAKEYLTTAYQMDPEIKAMALADTDLKPMWQTIAEMRRE